MSDSVLHFLDSPRTEPVKIDVLSRRSNFREIYRTFAPAQAHDQSKRCISCGIPYCGWKCPVHNDIPGWLQLASSGRLFEAAELCHETNSLPEICGRVCPQDRLCEGACTLNTGFGAVTIGSMEKWIVDTAFAQGWRPDLSHIKKRGKRVAIIGSGPAGLSCADVLTRRGVDCEIFERNEQIGGLMMFGIPDFKLEKKVVLQRREIFESMGLVFHTGCEVGRDIAFDDLLKQFDAVFLGTGAEKPVSGNLPGENALGVVKAMDYLVGAIRHNNQLPQADSAHINCKSKRVVVLGGGDTAMDCVRTAIRQGASEVICMYRRTEQDMPGSRREIANAKEEGVQFLFEHTPVLIESKASQITGVRAISGAAQVEQLVNADAVIIAFGYRAEVPQWLQQHNVQSSSDGKVMVGMTGTKPFQSHHARIFAGGDNVRGADLVVNAVADGRAAAKSILSLW